MKRSAALASAALVLCAVQRRRRARDQGGGGREDRSTPTATRPTSGRPRRTAPRWRVRTSASRSTTSRPSTTPRPRPTWCWPASTPAATASPSARPTQRRCSRADAAHRAGIPLVTLGAGIASFARLHALSTSDRTTARRHVAAARMADSARPPSSAWVSRARTPRSKMSAPGPAPPALCWSARGWLTCPSARPRSGSGWSPTRASTASLCWTRTWLSARRSRPSGRRVRRRRRRVRPLGTRTGGGPRRLARFATDEQPYLEGYLPVVLSTFASRPARTGGGRPVHSGPVLVSE